MATLGRCSCSAKNSMRGAQCPSRSIEHSPSNETISSAGTGTNQRGCQSSPRRVRSLFSARCRSSSRCLCSPAAEASPLTRKARSGRRRESLFRGSGAPSGTVFRRIANSVKLYLVFSGFGAHVQRRTGSSPGSGSPSSSHSTASACEFHMPEMQTAGLPSLSLTKPLNSYLPTPNHPQGVNSISEYMPVSMHRTRRVPKTSIQLDPTTMLFAFTDGGTTVYVSPARLSFTRVRPMG
mmetsp:Transcript_32697/g.77553  ORF Transcript_32697/g.77553 Transcript_32697/m.77553 type:complete len:237 (-) Transcript_32697:669-1379(-)